MIRLRLEPQLRGLNEMALQNGIDTVSIATFGVYTETYGSGAPANIANLYASRGFLENAPNITIKIINIVMSYFRRRGG
jgi:hypothetical protein